MPRKLYTPSCFQLNADALKQTPAQLYANWFSTSSIQKCACNCILVDCDSYPLGHRQLYRHRDSIAEYWVSSSSSFCSDLIITIYQLLIHHPSCTISSILRASELTVTDKVLLSSPVFNVLVYLPLHSALFFLPLLLSATWVTWPPIFSPLFLTFENGSTRLALFECLPSFRCSSW